MAWVLEKIRASWESRSPLEKAEEQEEALNQSTTTNSSSCTEILPHQDESQDFGGLYSLQNDGVNREEQAEGVAKPENQSGDTIPLE